MTIQVRESELAGKLLSARELEVLNLIAAGNTATRIARILKITPATVRTHTRRILGKLEANDRAHAITIAFRRSLIQ